ncbi:hypothetical protein HYQ45_013327 [Verticillium longisporum]|uniref:Dolichyl-diphosphooligosaccharide--protein glycosyltransferase subunit 4 n=1 Tax=Verticillium longisporum TaxID=100787 RepID=A0A0G4LF77_VERLO|nr:hypothetical protein HYQ45_013327 [Verticillium longisporum]KAG7128662.1 hypothetical protein HYQ44_014716 [Verticillium longisporum]CRK20703.1 hypothetical protein BN1723_002670 [Verticillium longisporum]
MSYQLAFGNLPHSRQTSKHPTSPINQASPGASRYHEVALGHISDQLFTMISDGELYQLAIVLGSSAMALIVVYHYLEVNAEDEKTPTVAGAQPTKQAAA